MAEKDEVNTLRARFRGFYPVVIDVETAGFNSGTDALLEIAAITLQMDHHGWLKTHKTLHFNIEPFPGSILQPEALIFNGIDPDNPLRYAVTEREALYELFTIVHQGIKDDDCHRAILVAHNAAFDHSFLMAAANRTKIKHNPFHPFATFDTAALSGLVLGQTVLLKACLTAGIPFNTSEAHSALYDAERTAELFCELVNRWKRLGGWTKVTTSSIHSV
ncbi:ribonuclease T [Candidatus Palibaumannia cicadellinicola]|uniref:Ribonuclease T n=1 Tax=Baumannia cicadellinicola subsp. Homalodisca coagulata TaxID=374463 RepID=RNT_BAUCH|nr:ribonuclease T [Candidatus Baumannia cicadellinicola]Q1LU01.1 RecName: Full=Ribonuclease T; AltName: Full=Exoribonuclease T; Short=RNase T [Baumannia cicadellinicola str. Hc (Homalodisca coagulata)]ABF14018.1 ribonuclease T [Baumannia cicadellinicola str. Hc (Homalodisca coagulata)]MBS0032619.1 ribonuclease T [Candidatus Baumannia cicadellinicola]MCJ7462456.1 ribonuclease T [Candidatus Baumannia cicadellinicola]MCJ7462859.1 ribonuclease T [Candidatus Baumannia cicadellinicola]